MSSLRAKYLSARYNLFPDHILGEILAKRWADNAIPFFTLIVVALGLFFILPGFYTSYNLTEYGRQYAELGLIVLGMTVVMMAGGLDLSVGSIFAIANLVALYCVHVLDLHPFLTLFIAMTSGALCGAFNGFFIGVIGMRAFLTTLVTLIVFRSIVDLLLLEYALDISSVFPDSELWEYVGDGDSFGLPYVLLVTTLVLVLFHFGISRMKPGWHLTAVGGSRRSAFNAGIKVKQTIFLSYVTCGILCSIAGYMYAARMASTGADTGKGLELTILTAAVLGGISLGGGRGSVPKAIFGSLIVLLLLNGLLQFGIQGGAIQLIFGIILLLTILIDVRWVKNRFKLLNKVYVSPTYFKLASPASIDSGSKSPYAVNDKLKNVSVIGLGKVEGPEDVLLDDDDNLYAGSRHGDIVRFYGKNHEKMEVFAHVGGHPLGLAWDKNYNLVTCIPDMGVISISQDREVTKITDQTNRSLTSVIDDRRLSLADDLDIAPDGRIFFSEATIRYRLKDWPMDCVESRGNGRIVCYDPKTNSTRTIIKNLKFANGVCVTKDSQSILFAETFGLRVSRYWFDGPNKGKTEVIMENIPGYPDNINRASDGNYWLALVGMRGPALDLALTLPDFRKRMSRRINTSNWLFPNINTGCVLKITEKGEVLETLWDLKARNHPMVTSMREHKGHLYLGGIQNNRIGKYKIPDGDTKWSGFEDYWGNRNNA
jgi:ribose transport system permease protein